MSVIKLENVQEAVQEHSWKVLSKQYINLDTEMKFNCPEGHLVYTSWKKLRNNFKCPTCKNSKIIPTTEIRAKSKGVMRILAIDDATNTSGWSVYDNKELIAYGKIEFTDMDVINRIAKVKEWMLNMINSWRPDKVAIEDIQLQTFANRYGGQNTAVTTYKALAQLKGVLLVTCVEQKIPSLVIHTATWRSHCKITAKSRTDQKRAAQLYVEKNFGKKVTQDEADAICIGKYVVEKHLLNNTMVEFGSL